MFMNANFDPKSIASPINFFYDLRLNEQVVADISKNFMINVMSQRAELVDDYLGQMKQTYRFSLFEKKTAGALCVSQSILIF